MLGGILLIAATLVVAVPAPTLRSVPGGEFAGPALFSAALLVFAFGLRGAGSITARRPLGTAALALLAVWTFADGLLWRFTPLGSLPLDRPALLGTAIPLITAALAAVACVQIARAGVVPTPWNWAPTWALIAVVAPSLLQMLLVAAGRLIVSGARGVGDDVGLDAFVVGVVLVAIGTSTPELATAVIARLRGHEEIGLGTVLGSNVYNGAVIVPVAALIAPITIAWSEIAVSLLFGIAVVALVAPVFGSILGRRRGTALVLLYVSSVVTLLLTSG